MDADVVSEPVPFDDADEQVLARARRVHALGQERSSRRSFFREGKASASRPVPQMSAGEILGDFRLVGLLGQGGMGQVWEAWQESLRRRVALKLLLPERLDARSAELFVREARASARLQHPGIVTTYAFSADDSQPWIAQELVVGSCTLKDFLDDVRVRDAVPHGHYTRVAELVAQVADALQAAHDSGVIHRDVKPQNILITPEDRPKLADFGLARVSDDSVLSRTGDFGGTYAYMSPEQVTAKRMGLDHRTDVFSLGVVLYELLALRRPFEGDTSHQVVAQTIAHDPPQPHEVRSQCPRDLSVICGKAIEKAPDRRYATAGELAQDIRRFLRHERILARSPGLPSRARKWIRRNPTVSGIGSVVLLALCVVIALLIEVASQREEVFRLAAIRDVEELVREADGLWPAEPARIPEYRAWIRKAESMLAELPRYYETRDALRADAIQTNDEEAAAWQFPAGEAGRRSAWWHAHLTSLIDSLERLRDPSVGLLSDAEDAISPAHGWSIPRRLAFSETMSNSLAEGGEAASRWDAALPSIRERYPELRIRPRPDVLPLGPDPESGLWEFWHVASGDEPLRGAGGALRMQEGSGLVFVLLPLGSFYMGTQASDSAAPCYDPLAEATEVPVHEVRVHGLLLSKFEMTQGQWKRLAGANPSFSGPEGEWWDSWLAGGKAPSLLHPVEQVSWEDCAQLLARWSMRLPSEAEWEYACRAGTTTPWWPGAVVEDLAGASNLADSYAATHGGGSWPGIEKVLDDGATSHAAVGSYRANPFGLHELHGNVWEWCRDRWSETYAESKAVHPGAYEPEDGLVSRVVRGGSHGTSARRARSGGRDRVSAQLRDGKLGVRPAIALDWW